MKQQHVQKQIIEMTETLLISSNLVKIHANDLIDQQIISFGEFKPDYIMGSVVDALNEIVTLFMLQLSGSSKKLKTDFAQVAQMFPILVFDKKRLQQVLLNLLFRAFKSKKKGSIKITAFVHSDNFESGMIEVQVCDRGTDMSQDEVNSLFDSNDIEIPSQRLQRHKPGLNICKKICENLGGEIEVLSRPDLGCRFKFTMKVMHQNQDFDNPDSNEAINASQINLTLSRQAVHSDDRSLEILQTPLLTRERTRVERSAPQPIISFNGLLIIQNLN